MPNPAQIDVAAVRDWLGDGGEIAFLDVREEGQHGAGHPLLAVNLPYSRLELDIGRLVPRRACRVVLIDGGDGVADRAARRLAGLGYSAVHVVAGGVPQWEREGHQAVPEHQRAEQGLRRDRRDRPPHAARHRRRTRPHQARGHEGRGARQPHGRGVQPLSCARRGELPRRRAGASLHRSGARPGYAGRRLLRRAHPQHHRRAVADQCRRAEQGRLVAGRDAGVAARRAGAGARYRGLAGAGQQGGGRGGAAARRRCHQRGSASGGSTARRWTPGSAKAGRGPPICSTYARRTNTRPGTCRDRSRPRAGSWCRRSTAGSAHEAPASCWWTIPATRAIMTAHWLTQMGWDVVVLDRAFAGQSLETGIPAAEADPPRRAGDRGGRGRALAQRGRRRRGRNHAERRLPRRGIPRARSGRSARVSTACRKACGAPAASSCSPTIPAIGALAAADLAEIAGGAVALVQGGVDGWRAAGHPFAASPDDPPDSDRIDYIFWNHDRHAGNQEAMRAYLRWETELPGEDRARRPRRVPPRRRIGKTEAVRSL